MTLLAQWKLQDNAASTTVVATVGSNGTMQNANTADIDVAGPGTLLTSALDFGAANVYIDLGNLSITQNKSVITVCGWFKADTGNSGTKYLFMSNTGAGAGRLLIYMSSSGFLNVQARAGDAESDQFKTTTAEYDDGNWHHLAVVVNYGSDTITFYIDGASVSSTGTVAFTASSTGNTASNVNYLASSGFGEFTGALADWRVYDSNESANLATIIAEKDVVVDVTPPTLTSSTVNPDGDTLTWVFNENVVVTNANGITFTPSGGASSLTYSSGSGTDTIVFSLSRTLLEDETYTIAYSSVAGDIEDEAGNDLVAFSAIDGDNASAQEADDLGTTPLPPETFTVPYSLPTGGTTYTPADSAALTTALAAAVGGDVIILTAGVTYTGNFKLRNWGGGTDWIYIISSAMSSLPAFGTRVDLDDIGNMPTITVASDAPVHSDFGAHHYRLVGIRIITGAADRLAAVQLGYNGDFVTNATTNDDYPHHLTFDRCVIGSTSDAHRLRHGIMLNGEYLAVVNCYIYNIKDTADAQAIWTFDGLGPFKIVNNFLEATGENIMFGGTDPKVAGNVPGDIEIDGNHLFKRTSWKTSDLWGVKNLLEFKNAKRAMVTGNVLENCWTDAQTGVAILLTVRNQEGTAEWSVVKDIDITNNRVSNVGSFIGMTGEDDIQSSQRTRRIRIHNNLATGVTSDYSSAPEFVRIGTPDLPVLNLTVTHNTMLSPEDENGPNNHLSLASPRVCVDGIIWQDNLMVHGSYNPDWPGRTANATHDHNVMIMDSSDSRYTTNKDNFASWHPGDFMSDPDYASAGFVDSEEENFRLSLLSEWKGDGTLSSDPGVDQDELEDETAGAVSGEWPAGSTAPPAGPVISPVIRASFSPTNAPLVIIGG